MQVTRPSVAVKELYCGTFLRKPPSKGPLNSQGFQTSVCYALSQVSLTLCPSKRNHGLLSMNLGETMKMKREEITLKLLLVA